MPRYDVRLTALALDLDYDWLDTTLARIDLPGLQRGGQGVRRTLSESAVLHFSAAQQLSQAYGIAIERAIAIAAVCLGSVDGSARDGAVSIRVDVPSLRSELERRLGRAMESTVPVRRGRPPTRLP